MDKFRARMRNRGQGGFTLIELLVVVAILAVLGGAVIVGVGALRGNAEEEVCKTDRESLNTAVQAYIVSEDAVPTLAQLDTSGLVVKNYDPADWVITGEEITAGADAGDKYENVATACNTP
jgi:prepilin-type N-terminal cleavage/methylation domain-containing protein